MTPLSVSGEEDGKPHYLHHLLQEEPAWRKGGTNTDPYIFGKQFIYSCCKQNTFNVLKRLEPDDIILFGSMKENEADEWGFMLDTVFVVGNFKLAYTTDDRPEDIAEKSCG